MSCAIAVEALIDRPTLFVWLFLIATSNKLIGVMTAVVARDGWAYAAFDLFGVSAILWLALAAGLLLARAAPLEPIRSADLGAAAVVFAAAVLPIPGASAVSLTLLAAYGIMTGLRDSALRRAAIIFLAMTGSLIWGPLLLALLSGPLLGADAYMVARLVGTSQVGNQVAFADGSGAFVVAPGCSSFQGMSLALVFWATVNQWFGVRFGWVPALWALAALFATIGINVARIGALAHFPAHFEAIHTGWGFHLASWTTLVLVVAICLYGARKDVLAKV